MHCVGQDIEADERGLVLKCPRCGRRNRATYENLGQTFRCGDCHAELSPASKPIEVHTEAVFEALTARCALPVLVDFWASWCGPCKMLAPELIKVATEGEGRWIVAKVSTEELPGLAQRFAVTAIPALAVFKAGRELARQAGAISAPAIRQLILRAG